MNCFNQIDVEKEMMIKIKQRRKNDDKMRYQHFFWKMKKMNKKISGKNNSMVI